MSCKEEKSVILTLLVFFGELLSTSDTCPWSYPMTAQWPLNGDTINPVIFDKHSGIEIKIFMTEMQWSWGTKKKKKRGESTSRLY